MKIIIRKAVDQDVPALHRLVGNLAEYERAAEQFTADLATYQRDFSAGVFQALVAEGPGGVVGMALYYLTYSTWKGRMLHLEDFIVEQAHRRKGIGQQLFDAFLTEAKAQDCVMVRWQVLDWNEPAIRFYEKNEAIIEQNWWNLKIIF